MVIPKISVIVPIYNVEKYISKCLDALIHQTFKDIEIICVDDGSKDDSAKIVQKYARKDSRIRYIHQKNQGVAVARNTGLKASKAPYIMSCDPDDWYDKTMCQKMYDAITQNDVDFACCGISITYETNENYKKSDENYYKIKFSGIVPVSEELIEQTDASMCNKIFKKSLIEKYKITFPDGLIYEDACFFLKYISVSKNVYFIREKLYNYVRHCGSIMNKTFQKADTAIDHIKIMSDVLDFFKENNLWSEWEKTFYMEFLQYFDFGYTHLPKDKKYKSFDVAIPIMKYFPLDRVGLMLPQDKKDIWSCILNKNYLSEPYVKRIKVAGITLIKFKQKNLKSKIFVLGIQILSKKTKNGKETYSILYIPIFKRRIKHV